MRCRPTVTNMHTMLISDMPDEQRGLRHGKCSFVTYKEAVDQLEGDVFCGYQSDMMDSSSAE